MCSCSEFFLFKTGEGGYSGDDGEVPEEHQETAVDINAEWWKKFHLFGDDGLGLLVILVGRQCSGMSGGLFGDYRMGLLVILYRRQAEAAAALNWN